jgi:FkbM family methyltransferase
MLSAAITPGVRNRLLADAYTVQELLDSERGREIVAHAAGGEDHGIDWVKQVVLNDPAGVVAAFEELAVVHPHVEAALRQMASTRTGALSEEQVIDVFLGRSDEEKRTYWSDRRIREAFFDDVCSSQSIGAAREELSHRIDVTLSPARVHLRRGDDERTPEVVWADVEAAFGVEVPVAADLLVDVDDLDHEQLWAIPAFRRACIDRLIGDDLLELKRLLADERLTSAEIRQSLFDALARSHPLQIMSAGGETVVLPSADLGFAKAFWADRRAELQNLDRLVELRGSSKRGTFVDVGANIATQSVHALASGAFDEALLIEPDPRLLPMLKANVALNGLDDQVRVVACAAGAEAGDLELWSSPDNWGDNRLGKAGGDDWTVSTVRVRTIDQILVDQGIDAGDVGLLWIDAQGHEEGVLAGAANLLAGGCDIVGEFWPAVLHAEGRLESTIDAFVSASPTWIDLSSGEVLDRAGLDELARQGIAEGESFYVDLAALRSSPDSTRQPTKES